MAPTERHGSRQWSHEDTKLQAPWIEVMLRTQSLRPIFSKEGGYTSTSSVFVIWNLVKSGPSLTKQMAEAATRSGIWVWRLPPWAADSVRDRHKNTDGCLDHMWTDVDGTNFREDHGWFNIATGPFLAGNGLNVGLSCFSSFLPTCPAPQSPNTREAYPWCLPWILSGVVTPPNLELSVGFVTSREKSNF